VRTTLAIDDDVLAVAKEIAEQRGASLGDVISELSRAGIEARRAPINRTRRIPTFTPRPGSRPVTTDDVRRALDE
jgi:hypothetical protein